MFLPNSPIFYDLAGQQNEPGFSTFFVIYLNVFNDGNYRNTRLLPRNTTEKA